MYSLHAWQLHRPLSTSKPCLCHTLLQIICRKLGIGLPDPATPGCGVPPASGVCTPHGRGERHCAAFFRCPSLCLSVSSQWSLAALLIERALCWPLGEMEEGQQFVLSSVKLALEAAGQFAAAGVVALQLHKTPKPLVFGEITAARYRRVDIWERPRLRACEEHESKLLNRLLMEMRLQTARCLLSQVRGRPPSAQKWQ